MEVCFYLWCYSQCYLEDEGGGREKEEGRRKRRREVEEKGLGLRGGVKSRGRGRGEEKGE